MNDALSITLRKREENPSCFRMRKTDASHTHEIFRFQIGTLKYLIYILPIKDE